jgi:hypothetical protein
MGQGQSNVADVSPMKSFPDPSSSKKSGTENVDYTGDEEGVKPTGRNTAPYDHLDALQEQLPTLIDEESRQQVDDYIQACDKGKGPMVACFATGEYIGMFERKVRCCLIMCSVSLTIFISYPIA